MRTTSFEELHKRKACKAAYRRLAKNLGYIKYYGRTTPITIEQIIEHGSVQDALWTMHIVFFGDCNEVLKSFIKKCGVRCGRDFSYLCTHPVICWSDATSALENCEDKISRRMCGYWDKVPPIYEEMLLEAIREEEC